MSATHYSWRSAKKTQFLNKSCEISVKKYEGWVAREDIGLLVVDIYEPLSNFGAKSRALCKGGLGGKMRRTDW